MTLDRYEYYANILKTMDAKHPRSKLIRQAMVIVSTIIALCSFVKGCDVSVFLPTGSGESLASPVNSVE